MVDTQQRSTPRPAPAAAQRPWLHPLALAALAVALRLGLALRSTGVDVASASFAVLGGVNVVLVWLVARRLGCGRRAALHGAAFYAVWFGAVSADAAASPEPIRTCALLGVLLLLTRSGAATGPRELPPRRTMPVAVAFGVAVVLGGLGGRFFGTAPSTGWAMAAAVRPGSHLQISTDARLADFASAHVALPYVHGLPLRAAVLVVVGLDVFCALAALQVRMFRPLVGLAAVQIAVLAVAPISVAHYSGRPGGTLALLVAGAAHAGSRAPLGWWYRSDRRTRLLRAGRWAAPGAVGAAAVLTAAALFG